MAPGTKPLAFDFTQPAGEPGLAGPGSLGRLGARFESKNSPAAQARRRLAVA